MHRAKREQAQGQEGASTGPRGSKLCAKACLRVNTCACGDESGSMSILSMWLLVLLALSLLCMFMLLFLSKLSTCELSTDMSQDSPGHTSPF